MKLYSTAISYIQIIDNCIDIAILPQATSNAFMYISALMSEKASKVSFSDAKKNVKLEIFDNKTVCISAEASQHQFALQQHDIEAILMLLMDFAIDIAFPEMHLDMELNAIGTGEKYSVTIRVCTHL